MTSSSSSSSQASSIFPMVETNTLPQDLFFQNPNFISSQFRNLNLSTHKVFLNVDLPDSEERAAFILSGDTLEAADTSEISNLVGKGIFFLGSCSGVFCVTDRNRNKFLLWNPATRETMVLPPPLIPSTEQFNSTKEIQPFCAAVGFGLDTQGGDLKVVRLMICEETAYYCRADVYSLKSRRWRQIQVDLPPLTDDYNDLMNEGNYTYCCNGSYHWVSPVPATLLSFDMTRDVFELSNLPVRDFFMMKICKGFGGCLLAIASDNPNMDNPNMEVWSMVGSNNWKLVKRFGPYLNEYRFLMPLWRDDDEILFVMPEEAHDDLILTGELCFLNITKQHLRNFPNLGKGRVHQLLPYEISFVSIHSRTGSYNY